MLADYVPIPAIAVKDLARARAFYEGTLGFSPAGDVPEGVIYPAGNSAFLVYPSKYAGTNKATAMSFQVTPDAFDDEVAALRAKGLSFQTFEIDGLVWDGVVAIMGDSKAVWFADPDGNVLNVESAQMIT